MDKLPIPPLPGPTGGKIDISALSADFISKFAQPLCPDKPVGVGDKWQWEITVDPLEMLEMMQVPVPAEAKQQLAQIRIPIQNTSTLVGFEEAAGVECARIEAVAPWRLQMPVGGREGTSLILDESGMTKVVTLFDYAAGRKVRETTRIEVTVTLTSGTVTRLHMTMHGDIRTELTQ